MTKEERNKYYCYYRKTKKGLIHKIYGAQIQSSKERGHLPPNYSNKELREWVLSKDLFHILYDEWVVSGHEIEKLPSIDRKDDYKGYSLDNIQIMTWGENKDKYDSDRINGVNNKQSKAVIGIHIITGEKLEFYSTIEAHRRTGINNGNISKCCYGKRKTAGEYKWKFNSLRRQ